MHLNKKHYSEETWADMMGEARPHLEFVFDLYRWQQTIGRLWLHEHPDGASPLQEASVKNLMSEVGVYR
eukprot:7722837-Prorocentrum_lima.AAC.1